MAGGGLLKTKSSLPITFQSNDGFLVVGKYGRRDIMASLPILVESSANQGSAIVVPQSQNESGDLIDLTQELNITAETVAEEHWAAYESITPAQWEVFRRITHARNIRRFQPGKSESQILEEQFSVEAQRRRNNRRYNLSTH